ncbi:MAG: hypothetical protein Q7T86_13710 [Hyphomicrobiaceae bacterium]|nr:hypothetical protein [Hyphomicrobiaceae bacterium]
METLFANGRIVDIVIAFMALEAVALLVGTRWLNGRLGNVDIVLLLVPGLFLLLAMRAAMTDAGWIAIAAWLLAALVAHLADLARRLRQG